MNKKVLVVDDDPALAELIAEFCRGAGLEARTVTNSLAAFEAALTWQPHLITLDIEMPGVSGIELLKTLQSDPITARIPVIVISVVAKGALEEGNLEGARAVFEKPLRFNRLVDQVQELIDRPEPAKDRVQLEPYSKVLA